MHVAPHAPLRRLRARGVRGFGPCAVVLAGLGVATPAHAQSSAPTPPRVEVVRSAVEQLADSARVRVIAPGVYVDPGYFLGIVGDSLHLADADVRLAVAFDEVEEMAVRQNRWLKIGLTTGAVAAVFGGAMGFFKGTQECSFEYAGCGEFQINGMVRWGSRLGVIGGVIGAVVGTRMDSWMVVFPR